MAKLKAKKKTDEEVVDTVENSVDTAEEENEYMTPDESTVLSADGEEYKDSQSEVSSERMQTVLDLLQEEYDIKNKGFELTGYADKATR